MRLNYDEDDKVEVQMSPLIDCVFLLLIFFLVTTICLLYTSPSPRD